MYFFTIRWPFYDIAQKTRQTPKFCLLLSRKVGAYGWTCEGVKIMAIMAILMGAFGGFATFVVAMLVYDSSFSTAVVLHIIVSLSIAGLIIMIKAQRKTDESLNSNEKAGENNLMTEHLADN